MSRRRHVWQTAIFLSLSLRFRIKIKFKPFACGFYVFNLAVWLCISVCGLLFSSDKSEDMFKMSLCEATCSQTARNQCGDHHVVKGLKINVFHVFVILLSLPITMLYILYVANLLQRMCALLSIGGVSYGNASPYVPKNI